MKNIILFLLTSVFVLQGCNSKKENTSQKQENPTWIFEVKLKAIVESDDTFSLFYMTDEHDRWGSDRLIKKEVTGNSRAQEIIFTLHQDDFPTKLRIDLGNNTSQNIIDLYKLSFSYGDEMIEVKENMISKYFICNKYAEYIDKEKADLRMKVVDDKYNPLIIATEYFMDRIDLNLYK